MAVVKVSKLKIDTEVVDEYVLKPIDKSKVKAILISHSHHDHIQDLPYILDPFRACKTSRVSNQSRLWIAVGCARAE